MASKSQLLSWVNEALALQLERLDQVGGYITAEWRADLTAFDWLVGFAAGEWSRGLPAFGRLCRKCTHAQGILGFVNTREATLGFSARHEMT
jgi:hypothetical protein